MTKPTITIQNGHRNAPNGQTGTSNKVLVDAGLAPKPVIYEVDLIDKVFYALSPKLIEKGIVVYYDDATIKNGRNTDYFIALHFDGATNPTLDARQDLSLNPMSSGFMAFM